MAYVPRRILITQENGTAIEHTEAEFASIRTPRILLGEPGAGKSDTATEIQRLSAGHSIHAELLASNAPIEQLSYETVIVDGVDEVLANGAKDPITAILNRLLEDKVEDFVLTCRAMDWQNATSEVKIVRRFNTKPVIGQLQPLSDDEMASMVEVFSSGKENGAKFVAQADEHKATELARNPQSLLLLLEAIAEIGWPKTRRELYESACLRLTREANPQHQSLRPNRPSSERIMKAAGFVFAQILLSGKRGVATDGQLDDLYPRPADLQGDHVTAEEIEAAMGSALMRVSSAQTLEPCHRTVAEYLAARWLASALADGVSLRRLESLLYAAGSKTVPTSLRGIHAWLAVLDASDSERFIDADPYGVLRYGDAGSLADDQIKRLLRALPTIARSDPLFRSEDWNLDIGRSLARDSLKDEIVTLIADKDASYQLTTVILESVKGTALASRIRDQLRALALDNSETYVERLRAAEAAAEGSDDTFVIALVDDLRALDDISSTRLALETMDDRPSVFSGTRIAQAMVAYHRSQGNHKIVGVGYRLLRGMTPPQLIEFLDVVAPILTEGRRAPREFSREVEDNILEAVESYLRAGAKISAKELWRWLKNTDGRSYRHEQWHIYSSEYFGQRNEFRRQLQIIALEEAKAASDIWSVGFKLTRIARGIAFRDDDLIVHMDDLLVSERRPKDWAERWHYLFQWAQTSSATGIAAAHARSIANDVPELKSLVEQLDNQPEPEWQREQREDEKTRVAEDEKATKSRWRAFSKASDEIASGQDLYSLDAIANAYFGWFPELDKAATPLTRLAQMVGQSNVDVALAGLRVVRSRSDIPTVRAGAELNAQEGKTYFLELISVASCALHLAEGGDLATLPRPFLECALAGLDWGLFSSESEHIPDLEAKLRALVFDTPQNLEGFVRDDLEPLLEAKKDVISGIYRVMHENDYAELAGRLSVDWLGRFPEVSAEILGYILDAAIGRGDKAILTELIAERLKAGVWPTEEHRALWYGAAFALDFERFRSELERFAIEKREHLWPFQHVDRRERYEVEVQPIGDMARLTFLIDRFGLLFPLAEMPSARWGSQSDYDGGQYIASLIKRLGSIPTNEANTTLLNMISEGRLGNHKDEALHVAAIQDRILAELSWGARTLEDVRSVLQSGPPGTIDDLQAFIMDELEMLQREIQDGTTQAAEPFWSGSRPQEENYCRDRIIDGIHHRLERRGVRSLPESTMPHNTRCDVLCISGTMDIPIEVKGQWHTQVWTAACQQLEDNYVREYRAEGRGIFLVVWFGRLAHYNPPRLAGKAVPESAADMLRLLAELSPRPIDGRTKLFVLDVSRPVAKSVKVYVADEKKSAKRPKAKKVRGPVVGAPSWRTST